MEKFSGKGRLIRAFLILSVIIVVGVSGYMLIEGDNFLNAIYMTIITISTVGFGEIHTLSVAGKLFTIFLILSSFGTYAYAISILTSYFIEGKLGYLFIKGQRNKSLSRSMENHVIVCGYGRNGQQVVEELQAHNQPFVIIEQNHDLINENLSKPFRFIEGDGTQDETLMKADIDKAKAIITTMPLDADNLYVVITARALNPDLKIISRASSESSEKKLRMAGVDSVVLPERVGGSHMATLVAKPDVIEFLEYLSISGSSPTNLEEIVCSDLPEKIINQSIGNLNLRKISGANIIGFKNAQGEFMINPTPDTKLLPGTKMFVLGTKEQIKEMKKIIRSI